MGKETSVFLDTNIIQTFLGNKSGSNVFLNSLGICSEYHDLSNFITKNRLEGLVEICIPEVVVLEMKYHMNTGFVKQTQKLQDDLGMHKKLLGTIADFEAVEIKHTQDTYSAYVDSLFDDFFNTPKNFAKQVPIPRQEYLLDTLLNKAITGTRPFFSGKIGGKAHSDAGFKDSVIAETIYGYSKATNRLCIYVTEDQDFSTEFDRKIQPGSSLVLFSSIESVIKALAEYYETDPQTRLMREFTENVYWHECLLHEAGLELDESVTERTVESVTLDEDDIFIIQINFVVNEAKYLFYVKFDNGANDILDLEYDIEDD